MHFLRLDYISYEDRCYKCTTHNAVFCSNKSEEGDHVVACPARTSALVEEERSLELHSLLAVQADGRVKLTDEQVRRDAVRQLCIS